MSSDWENIFSNLKKFETELTEQRQVNENLRTQLAREKREVARIAEALNSTIHSLQDKATKLQGQNDGLRNRNAELEEQVKLFSQSLYEVRKTLNDAQEHFDSQKQAYEEQQRKMNMNLVMEKQRAQQLHERVEDLKSTNDNLLKDLRKLDIKEKRADDLQKTLEIITQEKTKTEEIIAKKSQQSNQDQLDLAKLRFRVQQLEDELNDQSRVVAQLKEQENQWKKAYHEAKRETENTNRKAYELNTELKEYRGVRKAKSDAQIENKIEELQKAGNDSGVKNLLWDKKREIARAELKARDIPAGHPHRDRIVENLVALKKEREALQRELFRSAQAIQDSAKSRSKKKPESPMRVRPRSLDGISID